MKADSLDTKGRGTFDHPGHARHTRPRDSARSLLAVVGLVMALAVAAVVFPCRSTALAQSVESPERPKIGLVLAGGGAKGVAHVGVIKVLEEAGTPIDMIAGTSMGAIVGALYAMGYSASELEQLVRSINWDTLFVDDTPRQDLTIRRKTDDLGFLADPRLRLKDGEARIPIGAIKGQRLTIELRRLLEPAQGIDDFDKLPRPFRAVAADIETGEEVVLGSGELALAVRASMSFPGAFPPVEMDGRVLIDGGVVNNIPVDVVRAMGADIVIVSNFEQTPVSAEDITSAPAVVGRAMDIMMLGSRQEQLGSLGADDVLIVTDLGDIGVASFDRAPETIAPGEAAAREHYDRLALLGRVQRQGTNKLVAEFESRPIRSITIETDTPLSEDVLRARLRTKEGDTFDRSKIEADLKRIYGLGLFETVTYEIEPAGDEVSLKIVAKENTAGKDYLRFGLNLQTDLGNDSSYDVGVSYTVPAINELNGEWRSSMVLGDRLGAGTELYQPLDPADTVYLRPAFSALDRDVNVFDDEEKIGEARVFEARGTFDAGLNFSDDLTAFGRISRGIGTTREVSGEDVVDEGRFDTARIGAGLYYDTFDNLDFPRDGALVTSGYDWSPEALGADADFQTLFFSGNVAGSYGRHTLLLGQLANVTIDGERDPPNLFQLGGPFRLSGLIANEVTGDNALLSRGIYYYELERFGPSFLHIPLYIGATIEYGNAFQDLEDINVDDMLLGGNIFIGADTFLGPLYLGYGTTEGEDHSVFLSIGGVF